MALLKTKTQTRDHAGKADALAQVRKVVKGPTKRLNVDVPVDVFKKFKVKATMEDRAMTDIVHEMLLEYLSDS